MKFTSIFDSHSLLTVISNISKNFNIYFCMNILMTKLAYLYVNFRDSNLLNIEKIYEIIYTKTITLHKNLHTGWPIIISKCDIFFCFVKYGEILFRTII